ncbi:MAG TPA: c-type cytochrome [Cytophagaceae bacterium]|jgi:mono/diheme cytochrome c family protein|nr:c-type cytochrome [Cytophagaceae bacterium]
MSLKILQNRFSRLTFLVLLTLSINFSKTFAQSAPASGAADPAVLAKGKELFEGNCTACHAVHTVKVGPALKDIKKRRDIAWITKFVHNSTKVIKIDKDPYAVALYAQYNNTEMTSFPSFKDDEIASIVAYIMDESTKPPVTKDGGKDNTLTPEKSAPQNDYSDLILILTIVILVLVSITLIVFITVIRKYLKERENSLDEEDKELVNQKFRIGVILKSKAFIIIVCVLFTCVAVRSCWVGMMSIGIEQNYAPVQPIPFSHQLHAGKLKIDCGYCHTGVYRGKQANIPGVNICMNCHSQVKEGPRFGKEGIAVLLEHYNTNKPIQWVRVHNLPDLAYFNHSQHTVAGGIECTKCHGQIDSMEVVKQFSNLTMGWCINCHRETAVNGKGNAYYDRLLKVHDEKVAAGIRKGDMKVEQIGGLECSKCHY